MNTPSSASPAAGCLRIPPALEAAVAERIARYPQPRGAALMVLHALQDHFGFLSNEAIEWAAARLGVQPMQVLELATFYPMFRQEPPGRFHFKICRTLSCALAGSLALHARLCDRLGLDPASHGPQTTADGRFTVELVECLASCHTAPVLFCNQTFCEKATPEQVDRMIEECRSAPPEADGS
ncbi:MAG TPA: NAD(P)H-dependent oxidoreductase subunit E [Candidatus Paceibacterota bacterium]|nr:NAD(P)H-dependent oxidoreductase subunit E [Verrucomicrobiota bacterium]HOX01629.1 NAD(P)H-dependent oxidoreductase subunit E [Verrucomicrobiota bacterium]HRZ43937.1 NAD(P)H-dependent oxidoreductase subunit E [Candidatus Paceibacterota bacterium]HRZ93294.1 NAD(P)H-dependent oxidoreductase subunit E [Candidatus Paceibacterota bacterium]